MYLVDTNVLSQSAPERGRGSGFPERVAWMDAASAFLWLSVVTVAEIEAGIEIAGIKGEVRKAATLRSWLRTVEHL